MEKIKSIYLKHREAISYLFFGGLTTVVSWLSYSIAVKLGRLPVDVSNVISWIISVTFAFITNKTWVFDSRSWAKEVWVPEAKKFYSSRIATGVLDVVGVHLLCLTVLGGEFLGVEGFAAKIIMSVLVVILNYVLSKLLVFKGR